MSRRVAHTYCWEETGPLGLKLMHCGKDSDDAAGVQVSGFEDSFPDAENSGIKRGMKTLSVNGEDVSMYGKKQQSRSSALQGGP